MPAGTRTYRTLDETFSEPRVLPPPPTRHALLVFLITLASILHIGTAGWSDIHNGAEGRYAGAAREMLRADTWLAPQRDPPLLPWLNLISFKIFGATSTAAHLPVALAMVASVALTFLIGELLAGHWRGFVAGLIHLCCLGSFVWGRIATPEPVFAAFIGAAIFCGVCGYQRQRTRRAWFALVWICAALACLTKGAEGVLYPAAIFILLSLPFREARLRFRLLLHWPNILLFLALVAPWYIWAGFGVGNDMAADAGPGIPIPRFLASHALWWFPALGLVLPGVVLAWRKVFRPHEFDAADALPLFWMAVCFLPLLANQERQDYESMSMWSAFSLWSASAWGRTPPPLRIFGLFLTAIGGMTIAGWIMFDASRAGPLATWDGLRSMTMLISGALTIASILAGYFLFRNRENVAITVLMLGMVPVGLSTAEGIARAGSHLSLANAARFLQPQLGETGEILYEGSSFAGSSLWFYLDRPFHLVDETAALRPLSPLVSEERISPPAAIEKMSAEHPVYLIIHKNRVPYWQEKLTERFHLYHQETTCGPHVVVSNVP